MLSQLNEYFAIGKKVALPGINEHIQLPKDIGLRYDGAVPSLRDHFSQTELLIRGMIGENRRGLTGFLDKIWDQLMVSWAGWLLEVKFPDFHKTIGYCSSHKMPNRKTAYVIAKQHKLPPELNVFTDGHESGEFLEELQGGREILAKFLQKAGIKVDVSAYAGENFADIGGLIALKKANLAKVPTFGHRQVLPELIKSFDF